MLKILFYRVFTRVNILQFGFLLVTFQLHGLGNGVNHFVNVYTIRTHGVDYGKESDIHNNYMLKILAVLVLTKIISLGTTQCFNPQVALHQGSHTVQLASLYSEPVTLQNSLFHNTLMYMG